MTYSQTDLNEFRTRPINLKVSLLWITSRYAGITICQETYTKPAKSKKIRLQ